MINIPVYVLMLSVLVIALVIIELKNKTKGICSIIAGLIECSIIFLCFISGVTIIEQLFLAVLTAIIIISIIVFVTHNEVK